MTEPTLVAYKILTSEQRRQLEHDNIFMGSPQDCDDGFIHLSTGIQLNETLDKHFADQAGLHIASRDLATLGKAIRWEESRGGQVFPHLYAPLPRRAVTAIIPVARDADGNLLLPD